MGREFYLYRHKNGTLYAEIVKDGARLYRSTGIFCPESGKKRADAEKEAERKVIGWLTDGIPAGKGKTRSAKAAATLADILKTVNDIEGLDADGVAAIAEALRKRGLLDVATAKRGDGDKGLIPFLVEFWDFDRSAYLADEKALGHRIGKNHCRNKQSQIATFWKPFFKNIKLKDVTRDDLKRFRRFLSEKRERPEGHRGNFAEYLSNGYKNHVMRTGTKALHWAFAEGKLAIDPTADIKGFSKKGKKRGAFTPLQVEAVFKRWKKLLTGLEAETAALEEKQKRLREKKQHLPQAEFRKLEKLRCDLFDHKRAYVGNMLAATTGMRSGEVLAVRKSDIDPEKHILWVNHSWSAKEGLKCTKTEEERRATLYPEIRSLLLDLIEGNPYGGADPSAFYSILPDKPMEARILLARLREVCAALEIPMIDAKGRKIDFHSWRHYFSARLSDRVDKEKVMKATGHKTEAVFDVYADHVLEETFEELEAVGSEVFSNILSFDRKGA